MTAVPRPEHINPHDPVAEGHMANLDLGESLKFLPYISCERLGFSDLLPNSISVDSDKLDTGYTMILQTAEIPETKPSDASNTYKGVDWFGNEEKSCETVEGWAGMAKDIKIWNWGNSEAGSVKQARDNKKLPGAGARDDAETSRTPAQNDRTTRAIALRIRAQNARTPPSLLIHWSLLKALKFALFGTRFQSSNDDSLLFNLLHGIADGYTRYLISRILDSDQKPFETGRPIAHVILDVIACITFIKSSAKKNEPSSEDTEVPQFCNERGNFWAQKLGLSTLDSLFRRNTNG